MKRIAAALLLLVATLPASPTIAQTEEELRVVPGEFLVKGPVEGVAGVTPLGEIGQWTLVRAPAPGDPQAEAARLSGILGAKVVPNIVLHLFDDPLFPQQWPLHNTGQTGGTADADIDAPEAWDITTGDPSVIVAVVDSGVDLDHPDLAGQLVPGHDYVGAGPGDPNPTDPSAFLHGTAVAGVIAAALNGAGLQGVAYSARIMPLRVCEADEGGCAISDIAEGVVHAANAGVDIINISLGGYGPIEFFEPLFDAIAATDALVVAAAGNESNNNDSFPAYPASFDLPNVISVASTDSNDDLSGFSNVGQRSVHLAAPGGDMILAASDDGWTTAAGTSFAAPHVAGVAALLKSLDPDLTAPEMIRILMASSDPLPELVGTTISAGRLNAHQALSGPYRPIAQVEILPEEPTEDDITLRAVDAFDLDGTIVSYQWTFSDGTHASGATVVRSMVGLDFLSGTLTMVDDDGNSSPVSFSIDFEARPVAVAAADPVLAMSPAAVRFDATGSFDPEGSQLTFTWDFPTGADASGQVVTRLMTEPGVNEVGVTVRDVDMLTDRATVEILIGVAFTDMEGSTFTLDVAWISALGITRGCNPPANDRYCPNDPVTRGQMAAFLTRALNLPSAPNPFIDDNGHTFENDIAALAAAGITRGCNPPQNDRYCPNDHVTRGQMAAFLTRALNLPSAPNPFIDDNGHTFENDIAALAAAGITRGCNPPQNDRYCPNDPVTRGQMAAFLHRALAP